MAGWVMKMILPIALSQMAEGDCYPQSTVRKDSVEFTLQKPGIFTNGFIDVMNSGQVNASARFIRINIGDPEKFSVPISVYSGVSANNFQDQVFMGSRTNDHLYGSLINPLSGLLNISTDGICFFKIGNQFSRLGWLYQVGNRLMTGFKTGQVTDPLTGKPVNFLNTFAVTGFYFQTGAWERNSSGNLGLFWLVGNFHGCYSQPNILRSFLPIQKTSGIYIGYSIGVGVHINNLLNLRAVYYKYLKPPEIEYNLPVYQFTLNYVSRK